MIIGIDPDLDKSGIAILSDGYLELKTLCFVDTINLFIDHQDNIKKVVIEAGWLNKISNFHHFVGSKQAGEKIAKNVGENHATGKLLVQIAESLGLKVVLTKPTKRTAKKNAKEFNRITGWKGTTNQEERDAAMLVWGKVN